MNLLVTAFVAIFVFVSSFCGLSSGESGDSGSTPPSAGTNITVTYIANEGVLIEAEDKSVVIDGFHRFYRETYAYPPDDLRSVMEAAEGVWNQVDLVLVSHTHGDHFSAESVAAHLASNDAAKLISSPQVTDAVRQILKKFGRSQKNLNAIPYQWKSESTIKGDVTVRFLNLRHGSERFREIQNLGHIVEIGGKKFLHIGDADMTDENFEAFGINNAGIDVAFIPYWFLQSQEGRELVKQQFRPKQIIAVHVPPSEAESIKKELEALGPDVFVFTKFLETRTF